MALAGSDPIDRTLEPADTFDGALERHRRGPRIETSPVLPGRDAEGTPGPVLDVHVLVLPSFYPNRDEPTRGTFFRDQAQALARAGARVGIIYPYLAPMRYVGTRWFGRMSFRMEEVDDEGVPTLRTYGANPPLVPRLSMSMHLREWTRLMESYVRVHGVPDILHAHGAFWAGEAARRLSQRYGIPYVVTEHSTRFERGLVGPWQRRLARTIFAQAARSIAVSRHHARVLEEQLTLDRVDVVANVVDTELITPPQRPRPGDDFRFVSVGFLSPRKGMDLLIEAFASAFRGREDIGLDIGGGGAERERLERLADELQVARQVRFLGDLSREDVRDALAGADAFVLASHAETFGVVFVEALASGMPVIATRCGGPEEFVVPETGIIIDPGSVDQLTRALTVMAEEAGSYDPQVLRSYVIGKFGGTAVADDLLAMYGAILSGRPNPMAQLGSTPRRHGSSTGAHS